MLVTLGGLRVKVMRTKEMITTHQDHQVLLFKQILFVSTEGNVKKRVRRIWILMSG